MTDGPIDADSLDKDAYVRLVLRDVHDTTSDEEAAGLRETPEDIREWRDTLLRLMQDADAKLARLQTDIKQANRSSLDVSAIESERSKTMGFKSRLMASLRETKELLRSENQQFASRPRPVLTYDGSNLERLDRIEALLRRVLAEKEAK